ncbi:PKD domain-containing protein [Tessaracoccus sp. HDW20]|nr:LamG-like jellyroll fold domain-containing protein [Tessaracoccus coleopterorum]NHB84223.1 PKD domain-containing protein [Tessaracoccus coleopterorum]
MGRAYAKGTQYAPDTFSVQAWIRTNSTQGGRIVGFGDLQTGNSGHHDRHLYMTNDGRVVFGVRARDGSNRTVASGASFNDNDWHMVTATMGSRAWSSTWTACASPGGQTRPRARPTWATGACRVTPSAAGPRARLGTTSPGHRRGRRLPDGPHPGHDHRPVRGERSHSGDPAAPTDAYGAAVYTDDPDLFWRLEETGGTTANDSGRSLNPGTYRSGVTLGATGMRAGTRAAQFDGVDDVIFSNAQFSNPTEFSTEAWFKTTTTSGGKIVGFGNAQQGQSSNYDRHVYMLDDGRVVFGVWTGQSNTIETSTPYNDGEWHHVVATQSGAGMRLYVDGDLQGSNPQTEAQSYDGYWRVGGDSRWGGSSDYFNGVIDDVAVYSSALSAARVSAHFGAAGGSVNQLPTAEFVSAKQDRRVTFSGTGTDIDGTIESYAWDFGDGQSSAGQNPVHVYTANGTFTVKLTVTDNRGGTGTATHTVSVSAAGLPTDSYGAAVIADGPRIYWRLGESGGTVANDSGGGHSNGEIVGSPTLGRPGAIQNPDTAAQFGGDGQYVTSSDSFVSPQVYTNEAWFRTTSTTGGKVMGFGCTYQSPSNCYDRHIYLQPDGKVVFGTYTGVSNTITTDAAYNDGQWHHVVATQSSAGLRLYLDGELAGTHSATAAEGYTGYLHVGGDNTWGSDPWFDGDIDEVAFYLTALTPQRVAAHYTAGMPQPNQPPSPTSPSRRTCSPSMSTRAVPPTPTARSPATPGTSVTEPPVRGRPRHIRTRPEAPTASSSPSPTTRA